MTKVLCCALALGMWTATVTAQGFVSSRFSGVQTIQLPDGGPLIVSRVTVDRDKIRIENAGNRQWGIAGEVILLLADRRIAYQWSPGQTHITRSEMPGALPLFSPGFLTIALLLQPESLGITTVWSKVGEESIDGQLCDQYLITGLPPQEAIVHVAKSTRLPVRVRLQSPAGYPPPPRSPLNANWTAVEPGQPRAELFAVPQNLKVIEMPKSTMPWEQARPAPTRPEQKSATTMVPVPPDPKRSVVATASTPPPKISISTFLNDASKLDRHPMDVGNCRLVEHWSTGYCHVYSLGLAKKVSTETDAQCTERAELRNRMRQAIAERFCG